MGNYKAKLTLCLLGLLVLGLHTAKASTEECEDEQDVAQTDEQGAEDLVHKPARFLNSANVDVSLHFLYEGERYMIVERLSAGGGDVVLDTYATHQFDFVDLESQEKLGPTLTISVESDTYELVNTDEGGFSLRESNTGPLVDFTPPDQDQEPLKGGCYDKAERCEELASMGGCDEAPGWMIVNCPVTCNKCDLLDPKVRCARSFLNITEQGVWGPGDLNKMFENILEKFSDKFEIQVLSQPPEGPWILQFDNMFTGEDAKVLIDYGHVLGFHRSTDGGEQNERGEAAKIVSHGRTSENAWCVDQCKDDPRVRTLTQTIVDITGIPEENYEMFQVLKYQIGQEYKTHHDMDPKDTTPCGPRILTFFLYLSDVEKGGETNFPRLGLSVKPKLGRAILWPSVLDENPSQIDERTFHAALPVLEGTKFAANHWIHSHDYKIPNLYGCSGSFD